MNIAKRDNLIKTLSFIFAFCIACVIYLIPANVQAETANFSMVQSASIRNEQDGVVGLQFQSTVNAGWLAENDAEKYTFGTLIYPAANGDLFDRDETLENNIEALDAVSITHVSNSQVSAGVIFNASIVFDEAVVNAFIEQEGLEPSDDIVTTILHNLYNKEFTARAYVMVNDEVLYTDSYTTTMYDVALETYLLGVEEENEAYKALALNYFESATTKEASINFYDGALSFDEYVATDKTLLYSEDAQLALGEDYTIDENGNIVFAVDYATLGNSEVLYFIDNCNLVVLNATYGADVKSVSEALTQEVGSELIIRGYYVGVTNLDPKLRDSENYYTKTQLLIKDTQSDAIIGVRKEVAKYVAGTAAWTFTKQYTYGDEVLIKGKLLADDITINQNYLEFGENNPANANTVISTGNTVNYSFNSAITITEDSTTWTDTFNSNIKPMTLLRFKGTIYGVRMCGDSTNTDSRIATRENLLSYNTAATSFKELRVNSKYVTILDNVLTTNIGSSTSWTSKIPYGGASASANWSSTKKEALAVDFYALYVGSTSDRFELVILRSAWLTAGA